MTNVTWNKCSEGLPPSGVMVLALGNAGQIYIARILQRKDSKRWYNGHYMIGKQNEPVAWTELPEVPANILHA